MQRSLLLLREHPHAAAVAEVGNLAAAVDAAVLGISSDPNFNLGARYVGQAMKATGGRADAARVGEIVRERAGAS